jgi:hypothetical protein
MYVDNTSTSIALSYICIYDKILNIVYTTPNSCYVFTPFVYKGKALLNELKIRPGPAVGTLMDFQVMVTTLTILKVFCFYLD